MSKPVIRRATREDIEAYFPARPTPTMIAWVGEVDGEMLGFGGLALVEGRWYGFCDLKDGARKYKVTIAKTAKRIMDEARRRNIRYVYAGPDADETNALRWLKSLGFEPDRRTGVLYRWQL